WLRPQRALGSSPDSGSIGSHHGASPDPQVSANLARSRQLLDTPVGSRSVHDRGISSYGGPGGAEPVPYTRRLTRNDRIFFNRDLAANAILLWELLMANIIHKLCNTYPYLPVGRPDTTQLGGPSDAGDELHAAVAKGQVEQVLAVGRTRGQYGVIVAILPDKLAVDYIQRVSIESNDPTYYKNVLFVTTDDRVYGLGTNSEGVLGLGHNRPIDTPEEVPELTITLASDGRVFQWDYNPKNRQKPIIIQFPVEYRVVDIISGYDNSYGITSNGRANNTIQNYETGREIKGIDMYEILDTLGSGGFGHLCDFGLSKEVDVLSDNYKPSTAENTAEFKDNVNYMAPEGQTTEYNHLIDVYSLALIGAKIFGFDSDDIRDGV
ncbi:unnamed protein product, partial [Medioppia subpectinata]